MEYGAARSSIPKRPSPFSTDIVARYGLSRSALFAVIILIPAVDPLPNPALDAALLAIATCLVAVSFRVKNSMRGPPGEVRNLIRERRALIVALVFCEGAAIYGVAIHFITGSARAQFVIAIGIAGLLLHYPKREE